MTTQDHELSAALGWPGGISDPVLDRKTLLQMVAALRMFNAWIETRPAGIGASIRAGELVEAQQDSACLHGVEDGACKECYATETDLSRCPQCNGPADNGFDRSFPPSPYLCTKCMAEPVEPHRWEGDNNIESPFNACMHKTYCMTLKQDEPLNLADPAVQKRLATQWGYVPAAQAEPVEEPVAWNWMLDGLPYGRACYGDPPDADLAERAATAGRTVRLLYTAPPHRVAQQAEPVARECSDPMCACRGGPCAECEEGEREKEIEDLRSSLYFYQRRCEAFQSWQSKMRDPERTIVCDILANGKTLDSAVAGDRYTAPPQRKPLTEEEIMHIGMTHQSLRQVVRAVERAHGIGETK